MGGGCSHLEALKLQEFGVCDVDNRLGVNVSLYSAKEKSRL